MTLPFSTVRDLLRFAVSRFTQAELSFGHGSANAYDEAAYLVLHTLHLPLDVVLFVTYVATTWLLLYSCLLLARPR